MVSLLLWFPSSHWICLVAWNYASACLYRISFFYCDFGLHKAVIQQAIAIHFFFLLSLFDFSGIECVPKILLVQNLWRLVTLGRPYCNIATAWSWTNARIQESVSMPLWIWDTLFTQGEIQWWHSCQLHLRSYLCPLRHVGSIDI